MLVSWYNQKKKIYIRFWYIHAPSSHEYNTSSQPGPFGPRLSNSKPEYFTISEPNLVKLTLRTIPTEWVLQEGIQS
jgi:hypothetical protein